MSCAIDWAATGQMLSGWGALAGAGAIVWAAIAGRAAISDYREQKIIDKEIDAAESALSAAYRAFDAVDQMRGRWIPAHEIQAAEKALEAAGVELDAMDESVREANQTRAVIYRRAEFFKPDFDAVFGALPSAKVFFGREVVEWLKEFPKARNRMLNSADMLGIANHPYNNDREFAVRVRRDIFGAGADEEDPIRDMISSAVTNLECALLPKVCIEKARKR